MLLAERARTDRLTQIIKELQRHRFGRRAETLPIDQLELELGLEDVQQVEAAVAAKAEAKDPLLKTATAHKRHTNRGSLPRHLPRFEVVVDIESKACPCCSGELHRIGEDVAERLGIIPAQIRVLVTRRPNYACRSCEEGVVQAAAPARLIEGSLPTEATIAHVIVGKYADHLPLYRQAQIYARQGIELDRSTLADWTGRAAWMLRPVHDRLLERLKASTKLFADETTAPVLNPGAAAPRPVSSGLMRGTTGRGAGATRPGWPMSMRRTAKPNARSPTSRASEACCRWTAMSAIAPWPIVATVSSRSAEAMYAGASTNSPPQGPRPSPLRP